MSNLTNFQPNTHSHWHTHSYWTSICHSERLPRPLIVYQACGMMTESIMTSGHLGDKRPFEKWRLDFTYKSADCNSAGHLCDVYYPFSWDFTIVNRHRGKSQRLNWIIATCKKTETHKHINPCSFNNVLMGVCADVCIPSISDWTSPVCMHPCAHFYVFVMCPGLHEYLCVCAHLQFSCCPSSPRKIWIKRKEKYEIV